MQKIRWYDKNLLLKETFEFIERLDDISQGELAKDILQIVLNELNLDKDKCINEIGRNYNYTCKRWYDDNIDLYTSFEIIKQLDEVQQKRVVQKIIESAVFMYFKGENS